MRVLTLASRRSGAGKTMLAAHLSVQAARDGMGPVAVIDGDPSSTLSSWHRERGLEAPQLIQATAETLPKIVGDLRAAGVQLAVIDSHTLDDGLAEPVVAASDFVAIPTRPTADDPKDVAVLADQVRQQDKPFVFVLNRANADDDETTAMTLMGLAQHGTLATAVIPESQIFAECMNAGQTVMDCDQAKTEAPEISRLWEYLSGRMELLLGPITEAENGAQALDSTFVDNRRRFKRRPVSLPATLYIGTLAMRCTVVDISAGGAAVRCPAKPDIGESLEIEIGHVGRLVAEVRHHCNGTIGLQFAIPQDQRWGLVKRFAELIAD